MVLHHVAQRASAIVEIDAAFQPHRLGHSDLYMVDVLGVPQRFEQDVRKPQRDQVLHRFLAKIMVDAENAAFGKGAGHGIVDLAGTGEVGAQRFLQANARSCVRQTGLGQAFDSGFEKAGRGGQEDRDLASLADFLGQFGIAVRRRHIELAVLQTVEEAGHAAAAVGWQEFLDRFAREIAKFAIAHLGTCGADDPEIRRQQFVGIKGAERGQQHSPRKVSGRAE